jgi:hypothetical protein
MIIYIPLNLGFIYNYKAKINSTYPTLKFYLYLLVLNTNQYNFLQLVPILNLLFLYS